MDVKVCETIVTFFGGLAEEEGPFDVDQSLIDVLPLIVDIRPFIDTMHVRTNWVPSASQIQEIKAGCRGDAWPDYLALQWYPTWRCKIVMQRPTEAVLEYLDDLPGEILISRVDFALDYITRNGEDAMVIQHYFDKHFVKRWHGRQELASYKETSYSSRRKAVSNLICSYSDKLSKSDGKSPCFHLEWRCQDPRAVRSAGVDTLWDLVDYPHRNFWETRLNLQEINFSKLGRVATGVKRRKTMEKDRRRGHLIVRIAQYEDVGEDGDWSRPYGCVQKVKDNCRWIDRRKLSSCFQKLPINGFLPE